MIGLFTYYILSASIHLDSPVVRMNGKQEFRGLMQKNKLTGVEPICSQPFHHQQHRSQVPSLPNTNILYKKHEETYQVNSLIPDLGHLLHP